MAIMTIATTLSILLIAAAPQAPQDPLWQKAVAVAGANHGWVPGRSITRSETLRADGSISGSEEVWIEFHQRPGGGARQEITKVIRDGRDVTAGEKAKARPGDLDDDVASPTPFDPEAQSRVSARSNGETRTISGRPCRGFSFQEDADEGGSRGTAWLDSETGVPRELQFSPDPLPEGMNRLTTKIHFDYRSPKEWYPVTMETEGAGRGDRAGTTTRFRTSATFEGHWRLAPAEGTRRER
jgi:hypothetical protein